MIQEDSAIGSILVGRKEEPESDGTVPDGIGSAKEERISLLTSCVICQIVNSPA